MYFHLHIMDLLLSAFIFFCKKYCKKYLQLQTIYSIYKYIYMHIYIYIYMHSMLLSLCYTPKCALKQGDENPASIMKTQLV